jgi:cytochrome c6
MKTLLPGLIIVTMGTIGAIGLTLLPAAIAAEDGKALYEQKCAMCHGKNGVATAMGKGSKNFNDPEFQKANTAEAIAKVTADGKNKMPAYKDKLKSDQVQAIADYIKALGSEKAPEKAPAK